MSGGQPPSGEPIDADVVDGGVVDGDVVHGDVVHGGADPGRSNRSGVGAPTYEEVTGFTRDGVPTLDFVRDKIEQRTALALGTEELLSETERGRELDEQWARRERLAQDRLAEIRKSMESGS